MKPVVKIVGGDEYGPILEWSTHWAELVGKTLCLEDTHPPTGDAAGKDSVDAAPKDYRIVPEKPTAHMLDCGMVARIEDFQKHGTTLSNKDARRVCLAIYERMIMGAPAIASLTKTADGEKDA